MSVMERFPELLHQARLEKGMTQEQAAESVHISVRWYQYIEQGIRQPGCGTALELIALYEIDGKRLKEDPVSVSIVGQGVGAC